MLKDSDEITALKSTGVGRGTPGIGLGRVVALVSISKSIREDLIDHCPLDPVRHVEGEEIRNRPAIMALDGVADPAGHQIDALAGRIAKSDADFVARQKRRHRLPEHEARGIKRLQRVAPVLLPPAYHHQPVRETRLGPDPEAVAAIRFSIEKSPVAGIETDVPR
jgi:hypothetical protein